MNVNWNNLANTYSRDKDKNDRIRIYFKKARKSPDDLRPLLTMIKKINRGLEQNNVYHQNYSNTFITSTKQQCTVKFRYSDNKACHFKFLNGYMVQKYKKEVTKKPELFGNVSKEEYQKLMANSSVIKFGRTIKTSRHYKWILSPEKNLDEDTLKEYTRCFVMRLEQTTGYKFIWQAAVHQDTEHPHVHLLINGVDKDGRKIKGFSKDVIQNYAREISSEILTKFCGERDRETILKARENRVKAKRWTEFDNTILMMMNHTEETGYMGYVNSASDSEVRNRLAFLKEFGLAEFKNGKYYLKKNYQSELKTVGRYNVFTDAKQYVNGELKLYNKEMGEIKGKIKKVYTMNDEDVWTNACVIENEETGGCYFVPSFNPVGKKEGDNIKVVLSKSETGKEQVMFRKVYDTDIENDIN